MVLESQNAPTEAEVPVQTPEPSAVIEEEPPKEKEKVRLFGKMFKKKPPAATKKDTEPEKEPREDQPDSTPVSSVMCTEQRCSSTITDKLKL